MSSVLNFRGCGHMLGLSLVTTGLAAQPIDSVPTLERLVIQAQDEDGLVQVKQQLQQTPGGTNLIDVHQTSPHLASNADVLQGQPGIYAQSAGNEGVKISIRGSGINRGSGAHASGTYVLLDGIALTGPGGTPYELLEPQWLNHVEVLRGANGFERGALALGGAINYVSERGTTQQGGRISISGGQHATQHYQISYGQTQGALDYYLAATHKQSDGYQAHSQSEATGLMANVGYQLSDQVDTRFYLRYRETEHQTPGRLSQAQIQEQADMANPYNVQINARRVQPGSTWLANQTTWQLAHDGRLDASFAYHEYPMDLQESAYRVEVDYRDLTAQLNWQQPYAWKEQQNILKMGLRSTTQHHSAQGRETLRFDQAGFEAGTVSREYLHRGHDHIFTLDHILAWNEKLSLSTGLAALYTQRNVDVTQPVTDQKLIQNQWDMGYRLGVRYELEPHMELYSHLSRSVEPAHAWSMLWGSNDYFPLGSGAATGRQRSGVPLKHQRAHSIEVGGRGQHDWGQWEISYYYAALNNELLMVELQPLPNQVVAESNASDTLHQGIEVGLITPLWSHSHWGEVVLQQAYTWSQFNYQHDDKFQRNELAGIPKHFYQAQLQYQHPQGMSVGITTEYAAAMPIDYANSHYTEAYHIWGLNLAWQSPEQQRHVWLALKNLTNRHYSATITPGWNDLAQDRARATPGEGRSAYAGMSFSF